MVEGDEESGGGGVGLGWEVGVEGVLGGGDEGVPHAGAVVTGVGVGLPGLGVDGRVGGGEGQQRCLEQGTVLGRPAAADPDSAGPVLADREVPVEVGGAFLACEGGFEPAVDAVGVDHLDHMPAGAGEFGGVQVGRLADEDLLATAAYPVTGREVLDGTDDDLGLGRGHRPGQQGVAGPGQRAAQGVGLVDTLLALPVPQPGQMGEPVTGRAVVQLLLGQIPHVDLDHRTGLDRSGGRDQLLDLGDHLDQLVVRPCRPQRLGHIPDRRHGVGQHR